MAEDKVVPIAELKPGKKNIACVFIVIDRGSTSRTKDGSLVRKCRVADRTGSIIFSVWNEEAEAIEASDIIRLSKGYCSLWRGNLVLYCGKYGAVEKLGEFTMVFSETPDMSVWEEDTPSSSSSSLTAPSPASSSHTHQHGRSQQQPQPRGRGGGSRRHSPHSGRGHHHSSPQEGSSPLPPHQGHSWSPDDTSTHHSKAPPNRHKNHSHSNGHTHYHPYPQHALREGWS